MGKINPNDIVLTEEEAVEIIKDTRRRTGVFMNKNLQEKEKVKKNMNMIRLEIYINKKTFEQYRNMINNDSNIEVIRSSYARNFTLRWVMLNKSYFDILRDWIKYLTTLEYKGFAMIEIKSDGTEIDMISKNKWY